GPLTWAGQVPTRGTVHVQDLAVEDQPDTGPGFRTEDQQAVLGPGLVSRLLGDGPVDLGQVGGPDTNGRAARQHQCGEEWNDTHALAPVPRVARAPRPRRASACLTTRRYRVKDSWPPEFAQQVGLAGPQTEAPADELGPGGPFSADGKTLGGGGAV